MSFTDADLQFHPDAVKDLRRAWNWYDDAGVVVQNNLKDRIFDALDMILTHPLAGVEYHRGLRKKNVKGYPYIIFYAIEKKRIIVYAIAPSKRKPDYWIERIEFV